MSIFAAFVKGLGKTREAFTRRVETLFNRDQADAEFFDELEEILITADTGVDFAERAIARIKEKIKNKEITGTGEIKELLKDIILKTLGPEEEIKFTPSPPTVVLVLGVNGVGKTTTIGKLAYLLKNENKQKVLLGAGDTFRAAAVEQLSEWARRGGADIVAHQTGGDPGSVIFDAISAAVSRRADVVLCDTAGRLHTKSNLMEELKKIVRVAAKVCEGAPHEVLLVIDATTGQNAVAQAELFNDAVKVTGLVLTKLDGTAKGGIAVAVCDKLGIPIKYIGMGEGLEDLYPFNAENFVRALLDA